jgi:hypothetical protein
LDLLDGDVEGILGPDCPYLPDDRNKRIAVTGPSKKEPVEEIELGGLSLF